MSLALTQSVSFPALTATGSIDQYISSVNRMPMLSEQEEFELATRFREQGDLEAARKLVMSHLRLVVAIARNYLGYGLPHNDLIQEGNIGLMKAVKRFDPSRGVRLVSFAMHWIKAEIHEFVLKNWRLVKVATTKAQRKLFFNLRSLRGDSDTLSPQDIERVATDLNVRPEDVREMELRMGGHDIALENESSDDEDRFAPINWLRDPHAEPLEVLESAQQAYLHDEGLHQALAGLDERSRTIIQRRWLCDDGEAATLHELAAEYGVSAERIRQIEAKAMQKMKTALAPLAA